MTTVDYNALTNSFHDTISNLEPGDSKDGKGILSATVNTPINELYENTLVLNSAVKELQKNIGTANSITIKVVDALPQNGENNTIYLIKDASETEKTVYLQKMWEDSKYIDIGSTNSDVADLETMPIGFIMTYLGTSAPLYYLKCDGKEYNIVDYPELSNFIEKTYSTVNYFGGDGVTTFAVPYIVYYMTDTDTNEESELFSFIKCKSSTESGGSISDPSGIGTQAKIINPGNVSSEPTKDVPSIAYIDSEYQKKLAIGRGITISAQNEIETNFDIDDYQKKLVAGDGITIDTSTNTIKTTFDINRYQEKLTAGSGINIEGTTISSTPITYTAGDGIDINPDTHVISNTGTVVYKPGAGIAIQDGVIRCTVTDTDTTYTAGEGISISESNVISSTITDTNTKYTAGDGIQISDANVISLDISNIDLPSGSNTASYILVSSKWDQTNKTYDFTSDYPTDAYDIDIEPDGSSMTDDTFNAWVNARVLGGIDNKLKAFGDVPGVDIPVLIRTTKKAGGSDVSS